MADRAAVHGDWRWSWLRGGSGMALALCLAGGAALTLAAAGRKSGGRPRAATGH